MSDQQIPAASASTPTDPFPTPEEISRIQSAAASSADPIPEAVMPYTPSLLASLKYQRLTDDQKVEYHAIAAAINKEFMLNSLPAANVKVSYNKATQAIIHLLRIQGWHVKRGEGFLFISTMDDFLSSR